VGDGTGTNDNLLGRWQALIGARSEAKSNLVERGAVRRFAEAIGDPHPLYVEEDAAKKSCYGALIVPPTFPRSTLEYGEIEGLGLPDGEGGLIHGEHRIAYERPLFVGEELSCYTELKAYYEKESRGGPLGFLIFERIGESLEGERIFTMNDTVIVTQMLREQVVS
jgi:acyl dehydratase